MTAGVITHVLSWTPARFSQFPKGGQGFWALRTAAAFDVGAPPEYDGLDVPEDFPADLIAAGTALQVGFPVTLEPATQDVKPGTFRRRLAVPVYYVRPAVTS